MGFWIVSGFVVVGSLFWVGLCVQLAIYERRRRGLQAMAARIGLYEPESTKPLAPTLEHRTERAFTDLAREIALARTKFPENRLLLAALMEEVGELANAFIEGTDWRQEAVQVACVAIRIAAEGDSTHGIEPGS